MSTSETTRNILVVEDEWLVATDIAELIEEEGHTVIGPAKTVGTALNLIGANEIDAAFLDITLGSEVSFPIAEKLEALEVPLTFVTAYSKNDIPVKFQRFDLLSKPLPTRLLRRQIRKMLARRRS